MSVRHKNHRNVLLVAGKVRVCVCAVPSTSLDNNISIERFLRVYAYRTVLHGRTNCNRLKLKKMDSNTVYVCVCALGAFDQRNFSLINFIKGSSPQYI